MGRATAVALAGGGVDVGVTYHQDAEGAQQTAAEVREQGAEAVIKRLDLDDLPTAADAIDVLADEGGVDVLVNNAGTGAGGKAIDLDGRTGHPGREC
ncbi:MAG: SDR family NAD(P)-dependent oxidoreductase [Actinophytocola sp.]|nr:SDR family NAD(P)-dependent oxidoreductase [Actinophytocola sp.]